MEGKVYLSRQCIVCGKRTGAITCYRIMPKDRLQYTVYAHGKCFDDLRKGGNSKVQFKEERNG